MKIIYNFLERMTIQNFAEQHDLTMVVNERDSGLYLRYWASFKDCEIKEGIMLVSEIGNGNTVDEAIADYAKKIQNKILVYNAFCDVGRKEITVPRLYS